MVEITVVFGYKKYESYYMENKKIINNNFSDDQICELSQSVIEIYGSDLSVNQLDESIYLILENISGMELISTQEIQLLISQIKEKYYGKTQP